MNFDQLRSFRAVATYGGFRRAAESTYLTQSTISMQVAALERELGVKLFERLGRKIVLTHAGETMLRYANRILSLVDESRRTMAAFREVDAGDLVVGASLTIGSYLVPSIFGRFHRLHPGVRLVLDIAPTHQVASQVTDGALDVGLVEGPVDDPDLITEPFHMDELVLIVANNHRWATREQVSVAELPEDPFLAREPGSGTQEIIQERLAEQGIKLRPTLELGSPEALKQAVRAGLGVAIVSRATVALELEAGLLTSVPLSGLQLTRPFQTVLHRNKHISPTLAAFLELVRSSFLNRDERHPAPDKDWPRTSI